MPRRRSRSSARGFCGDFAAQFLATHARALLGAGEVQRAREVSAEAIAVAKRQGQPVHQCEATIAHVRCLRALDGTDAREAIEPLLVEVSQLIDQTGAERWRPHVHVERAELHRLTGDTAAADARAHRGAPAVRRDGRDGPRRAHRAAAGGVGAMNLLDVVREVRRHLEENGRLSLRMMRRQFALDDAALEEVIEELVDIQRVARREEDALAWSPATPPVGTPPPARDPRAYTPKHLAEKILTSEVRPRRRAQAGDDPVRRRQGIDGTGLRARPRGVAPHHGSLLPDPGRRRSPLRGHGQRVPR